MIVSWDWLKQYVSLDMSDEVLVDRLMMAGLNHESTTEVDGDLAIDLEVTSNRPDCLGHLGIAREVAVLFGKPWQIPPTSFEESTTKIEQAVSVSVEPAAQGWCPQYRARLIEGVQIGPSPAWLRRRLQTLGLPSINNVVDITNYVLMESGQPLHAFDFDKLAGRAIVVRNARAGEKFLAINNHTYELQAGMGVIADADRPAAIAGIMGGKESEVTHSTTNLLIESAEFLPLAIRRTSRAIDLSSDSSYRFERKIDPAGIAWASDRACHLITQSAGGKVARGAIQIGSPAVTTTPIALRFDRVGRILGLALSPDRMLQILQSLGARIEAVQAQQAQVIPPSFRRDLTREIDLIEEIGRIEGYAGVSQERSIPMAVSPVSREKRVMDKIRTVVLGAGYLEAMTFSFTDSASIARVRPWTTAEPIHLLHSSRKNENKLRQSLLPSLLEALRLNESRGNEGVRLFECAPVYLPGEGTLLPHEPMALGLVSMGDIRPLRGVIDAIFHRLAIPITFRPADREGFEPGQVGEYRTEDGDQLVAVIGVISAGARQQLDLRAETAAAELLLPPILERASLEVVVQPLPDRPAMVRDLAIVLDEEIAWAKLESTVRQHAGSLLESLEFVDLFRGKQIDAGKKSMAFRMTFRAPGRTLTREEIDALQQSIVSAIDQNLGGKLRA
jgi:phenylalanyl-tRNA synthetase beta chain